MFDKKTHPLNNLKFVKEKSQWKKGKIEITENRLEICGHPVMERWEDPYMKKLANIAASKGGKVLEIGFGLGISSEYIQQHSIIEHHIIEANEFVFENLLKFANVSKQKVHTYLGFWEDITSTFPDNSFDGILFDTYPITNDELHTARFTFFNEAYRLLKNDGVFTHYSGELEFTNEYIQYIQNAGFKTYFGESVLVSPPKDCLYWDEKYIMAPTIMKN